MSLIEQNVVERYLRQKTAFEGAWYKQELGYETAWFQHTKDQKNKALGGILVREYPGTRKKPRATKDSIQYPVDKRLWELVKETEVPKEVIAAARSKDTD